MSGTQTRDWDKQVTIYPINNISFAYELNAQDQNEAVAWITLVNQSQLKTMYKVKITNPNSYLVRPNQGVIEPGCKSMVKIIFNKELDSPVSRQH